jgi:hypothetical protein
MKTMAVMVRDLKHALYLMQWKELRTKKNLRMLAVNVRTGVAKIFNLRQAIGMLKRMILMKPNKS